MRADIFISVRSVEESLQFYINELDLFQIELNYGMNTYLISYVHNPSICLSISEGDDQPSNNPLFALEVGDCEAEYKRISNIHFTHGGLRSSTQGVFEYPLGKNFMMLDPSGNRFILVQGY